MLKRTLLVFALVTGTAHAEADTEPMLQGIHECDMRGPMENLEVKLAFTVTETGAITDMHVVDSNGSEDDNARVMKCVALYTYKPATHNGVPVARSTNFTFHSAPIQEMEGDHKAFALLERDADRRCHKLYPIDRTLTYLAQPISLVIVNRDASGGVQMTVSQSAGEKLDENAMACLKDILRDHDDLPPTFSRVIAVDWSHRR